MLTRTGPAVAPADAGWAVRAGGPPPTEAPRHGWGVAVLRHLGLIVLFALPAVALWWHAWDGHLASRVTCMCGDPGQEVWFVAWPAYAITHFQNPLFTHSLYVPEGANMVASTSSMLMGTLVAPVTWLFGPVAATNVLLTLTPALSAWGCYVACRRFTSWWPAAAMGALLFGYTPFVVDYAAWGNAQFTLLVVPPLALVCGYELAVSQRGPAWRWGVALGLLVTAQFFISSEILALMVVAGAIAAVVWLIMSWQVVERYVGYLARGAAWAAGVAVVLCAYPVWFSLSGPQAVHGLPWSLIKYEGIKLGDLWNPGAYAQPVGSLFRQTNYAGHQGPPVGYLGPLLVALVVLATVLAFRRRLTRVLAVVLVCAVPLALGIAGSNGGLLPWNIVGSLPVISRAAPVRMVAVVDLCAAVLVALGADVAWRRWRQRDARIRWRRPAWAGGVVAVVAVLWLGGMAMVFATYQVPLNTVRVDVPAWYTAVATRLAPGTVVLSYPFPVTSTGKSQAMVWQAVDGLRYDMAGGYLKVPGADGRPLRLGPPESAVRTLAQLTSQVLKPLPPNDPPSIGNLRAALGAWHVDRVVVSNQAAAPVYATAYLTAAIGHAPSVSHGSWVWNLAADPPAPDTALSLAAASLALQACAFQPSYGRAPAGRPLPMALPNCVARQIAAGN